MVHLAAAYLNPAALIVSCTSREPLVDQTTHNRPPFTLNKMNSSEISWLHLSDFHLGKDDYAQRKILEYILVEVDASIASGRKPDFVFITGDIANMGRTDEYALFDKEFLIPLLTKLGDSHFDRVFLVPGNHDVDRRRAKAVKRYDVLDEIQNFLDPTKEGRVEREPLLSRFHSLDDYPWYLEYPKWISSAHGFSAKRIKINGAEIGILSINTAWFCGSENELGKLTPGLGMVEQGLQNLNGCNQIFVLGHHPLDWFIPTHTQRMLAMLGQSKAFYLHGHLHKTRFQAPTMGNIPVVCLQSGCAFIARDDEEWLTRLVWGGFETSTRELRIRPKKWNPDHREWVLDSDAFPETLRAAGSDFWIIPTQFGAGPDDKHGKSGKKSPRQDYSLPEGWVLLDNAFLEERRLPTTDERVLQYFEGRVPQWEDILSGRIASRLVVDDLVETILRGIESKEPHFTLLIGAGGEGKSTAFLQTLAQIASSQSAKILWRNNPDKPLPSSFVSTLVASGEPWLLASDEGDTMIGDTFQALQTLRPKANIHFLLACRDTDWIENHGNDFMWNQVVAFSERRMKGLEEADARAIVKAWSNLGARGLGKLAEASTDDAVRQLMEAARVEATTSDGAFLGAMLRVRVGVALRDHVAALLMRLEAREIAGFPGKTLLTAFSYIAIPHAYNILFLSRPVLARAVGITEARVRRHVLGPLGEEAAAGGSGQFILTRHRAIAEAALDIVSNRFDIDPEEILSDLVRAAIIANDEGALVPQFGDWRYLSTRMFETGNQSLGVKLASIAVATDPTNSFLAVKLGQLYRQVGQAEQSANVFRKSYSSAKTNRAFYTEWATCEGFLGNRALAVFISAISITDDTELRPPDVRDIGYGLAGSLVNFLALFERYQNPVFLQAAVAADQIARRISLPKGAYDEIEQRKQTLIENRANFAVGLRLLLPHFKQGIIRAHQQMEIQLPSALAAPEKMTFATLAETARLQ